MSDLTIVMYHYVRDLAHSRFPDIKGRDVREFRKQLEHIAANYTVVTAADVMAASLDEKPLPDNACWLTFDDGYLDHFTCVLPLLNEFGFQGSFFPPVRTIVERDVLDVNKAHFILASGNDISALTASLKSAFEAHRQNDTRLENWTAYQEKFAVANAYDGADVVFFKRMLQVALPEDVRNSICDALFSEFVGLSPTAFANELYMSEDQVKMLTRSGMYVGSHGNGHYWLDSLARAAQEEEVDLALAFLERVGAPTDRWVMCYPYGAYNSNLLDILGDRNCTVGITTKSDVARIGVDPPLELPRVDTNELPFA
jgi:peptidoglycan/xylan/chitin deacetylase (PgdA/CDA1 family)